MRPTISGLSQEFVGGEAEAREGLCLDQRHTLVPVRPEALETLWRPASEGALGWLLFRSGSGAQAQAAVPSETPPKLWFAGGSHRIVAGLIESAGWEGSGVPAVALFELAAGPDLELGKLTKCGIDLDGQEISAEMPRVWIEHLQASPPKSD